MCCYDNSLQSFRFARSFRSSQLFLYYYRSIQTSPLLNSKLHRKRVIALNSNFSFNKLLNLKLHHKRVITVNYNSAPYYINKRLHVLQTP